MNLPSLPSWMPGSAPQRNRELERTIFLHADTGGVKRCTQPVGPKNKIVPKYDQEILTEVRASFSFGAVPTPTTGGWIGTCEMRC